MKENANAETRRALLLSLIVLGLIAAVMILPYQFRSAAGTKETNLNEEFEKTAGSEEGLENYDIRTDKSKSETLLNFRLSAGRDAVQIADERDEFVAGENLLRQSVPNLKVEYNNELHNPEVINADVLRGRAFLTASSNQKRSEILRGFAKENNRLIALTDTQINDLKVTADYKNPNGELSFARLEQFINGVPVFRAEIRAGFTKQGEMFRVVNNLAPEIAYESISKEFGNPEAAVRLAAGYINHKDIETKRNDAASTNLKVVFGQGDWATTAEKMYFPTEIGVARAAWRVLIWEPVNAYYVIVDAETGTMLYRENITHHQTQTATYNVYANTTSMLKTMANPAPLNPGPIDPSLQTQGVLQSRSNIMMPTANPMSRCSDRPTVLGTFQKAAAERFRRSSVKRETFRWQTISTATAKPTSPFSAAEFGTSANQAAEFKPFLSVCRATKRFRQITTATAKLTLPFIVQVTERGIC